jgi:hypothetical protein
MRSGWLCTLLVVLVGAVAYGTVLAGPGSGVTSTSLPATPVIDWSNEARHAIVPAGPGNVFGPENYGNKFPGEAGVYMGIVHVAIYDAAVAIEGGYEPYAIELTAPPDTSPAAAIATAAHHTLVGLQPALGLTPAQQAILDGRYDDYLAAVPDGAAKTRGIAVGEQVAAAVLALRMNDGREANPQFGQPPFVPPPSAPVSGSRTSPDRCWAFVCPGLPRSPSTARRSFGRTGRIS